MASPFSLAITGMGRAATASATAIASSQAMRCGIGDCRISAGAAARPTANTGPAPVIIATAISSRKDQAAQQSRSSAAAAAVIVAVGLPGAMAISACGGAIRSAMYR